MAIYLTLHRTLYTLEILSPWSLSIYWREICGNSICLDTWTWIEITQVFALFLSRRKNRMEEIINEKEYYAVWCWAHFVVILWPIICLQQNVECTRTKSHEIFDFCQRYIITHKTLFFCQANSLVKWITSTFYFCLNVALDIYQNRTLVDKSNCSTKKPPFWHTEKIK